MLIRNQKDLQVSTSIIILLRCYCDSHLAFANCYSTCYSAIKLPHIVLANMTSQQGWESPHCRQWRTQEAKEILMDGKNPMLRLLRCTLSAVQFTQSRRTLLTAPHYKMVVSRGEISIRVRVWVAVRPCVYSPCVRVHSLQRGTVIQIHLLIIAVFFIVPSLYNLIILISQYFKACVRPETTM